MSTSHHFSGVLDNRRWPEMDNADAKRYTLA